MQSEFERSARIFGWEKMEALAKKRVAVFGLGGVGGACFEALVRGGIGHFLIVDGDKVDVSNLNRQVLFTHDEVGMSKVHIASERAKKINPLVEVVAKEMFYLPENANEIDLSQCDYAVDAVDTVAAKLEIIRRCKEAGVPIISAMGCGNKVDPEKLRIADIYKTDTCPLARIMRANLRKMGIKDLKVVYSTEVPLKSKREEGAKRTSPGSTSFVPPVAGYLMAGQVIRDLVNEE